MLIIEFFEYKTEGTTALFSEQLITMDPPDPVPAVEPPPVEGKKRDLMSEQTRREIVSMLLLAVKPGDAEMNLHHGAIKSCADTYDCESFYN